VRDVRAEETATVSVEYALLIALVGLGSIAAWQALGAVVRDVLETITNEVAGDGS